MPTKNNLSYKAYVILEELIVTLELEPGKLYSEKELMEKSNMSRTPLREALFRLSNESLISILPRKGIEIAGINLTQQLSILETRRVLDNLLLARAARYATKAEKEHIKAFSAPMLEAAKNADVKEYLRVDKAFDQYVFEAGRNMFAANATSPLHVRSRRFWYYHNKDGDVMQSAKVHMRLIDAIVNSNEEEACAISNELIDYLIHLVKAQIDIY